MKTMPAKPPWPTDAIIIVAANAGEEIRENMRSVVECKCRLCHADLRADGFTIEHAEGLHARRGRPIEFFCIPCAVKHDVNDIDELYDHRAVKHDVKDIDALYFNRKEK